MRIRAIATTTAALLFVSIPSLAVPPADYGVDIYMSAPTVQGTSITNSVTIETFNSATAATTCPSTITLGAVTGDCGVAAAGTYGGASANGNDPTPTTGGVGSNYATTALPSREITITLNEPAKYLGLWWSAGSPSNTVELYSGADRVAYMSTSNLMTLLGSGTVSANNSSSYDTDEYNGNPRDRANLASAEPFLYLNLYGTGGASFDRIVLSGGGFEFDNIAVSDLEQTPGPYEVGVEFIAGENEPPVEENLASTGFNAQGLLGLGLIAVAAGAVALRRRAVR